MVFTKGRDDTFFNAKSNDIDTCNLITLGIPWDASSSYRYGAAKAPKIIRKATTGKLYNPYTETSVNIIEKWKIFDLGDVRISNKHPDKALNVIQTAIEPLYKKNKRFMFLGGDHLITYFCFSSISHIGVLQPDDVGMIYLDAHPDLYPNYESNKYSHACGLRRIIEETKIKPQNIFLIGIRASTPTQYNFARENGISIISRKEFQQKGSSSIAEIVKEKLKNVKKIYVSIDLDVLDPAFAPGVGDPEPGGLSTAEVVEFVKGLSGLSVFSFDIVEFCPNYDVSNITAYTAAKLIKEMLGIVQD
jgi:agmatinase